LTQFVWDEYGVEVTENFIDNTRWIANNFNLWHGFSIGYGDIEMKSENIKQLDNMFETVKLQVQHLVTEIENNPDLMSKEALENEILALLGRTNDSGNKLITETLSENNAFRIMQSCGSKGSAMNVGQMMGCLGLQVFEGKIMPKKIQFKIITLFPSK